MRILITGAAGRVGQALRKELAAAGHRLRLIDVQPIANPEGESFVADIADGKAVGRAMQGIEAVAHLAYGDSRNGNEGDRIDPNYDVNAKGTHHLLWAATQAKVQRFVYTSTLSVFGHVLTLGKLELSERSTVTPEEVYGLTKHFGEEACRFFADRCQLSVVCLRLCNVVNEEEWQEALVTKANTEWESSWLNMTTHVEDAARAVHLALTVPNIRYELIHVAADNKDQVTEIQKAKNVLGFWPKHRLAD